MVRRWGLPEYSLQAPPLCMNFARYDSMRDSLDDACRNVQSPLEVYQDSGQFEVAPDLQVDHTAYVNLRRLSTHGAHCVHKVDRVPLLG